MEILVAYCQDCDLIFDFRNSGTCPDCGELPIELVATTKQRPTTGAVDLGDSSALEVDSVFKVLSAGQGESHPAPNH